IAECGLIRNHACKSNLPSGVIDAEAQAVHNRPLYLLQGNTLRPVRIRQELMDRTHIQARGIGTDLKFSLGPEAVHQPFPGARATLSSFSIAAIFSTLRSCRPPANCVASHWSTMRIASSGLRIRAPSVSTLALLCSRLI